MLNLKSLIKYAIDNDASDIHLSVGAPPYMRIHGQLRATNYQVLSASDTLEALLLLMEPSSRERFEQAGQIDLATELSGIGRLRVNAYKQKGVITISIRIVHTEIPDCAYLKIPQELVALTEQRRGLIIVAGVARAGKSTVLASLIDNLNRGCLKNIITLEDPIEYHHKHKLSLINQREIGIDTDSYLSGIKSALREDPDVIMINSFKDPEVITLCLEASRLNKLVLVSMDAANVSDCIEKVLLCYKAEERDRVLLQLSESLSAICCRELLRNDDGMGVSPKYETCIVDDEMRKCIREYRLNDIAIKED